MIDRLSTGLVSQPAFRDSGMRYLQLFTRTILTPSGGVTAAWF
jgi:hypothetical protein